ncbi:hypothetical protein ACFRMQ_28745 [Kitasatospora sp. NPDC056783]|uniref:hypothetical protein n=1 Tax=Kitasatospora sp. NPDC056783 TaxID=3345943 RepID=UPI00368DDF56
MPVMLRPSVVFGVVPTGVFIQSPFESFALKLPPALVPPVLSWLAALEEPTTVEALLATAGGPSADTVCRHILDQLAKRRALLEVPSDPTRSTLPADALLYLQGHAADPEQAVRTLAGARVTLAGEQALAEACAEALRRRGLTAAVEPDGTARPPLTLTAELPDGRRLTVELHAAGRRLWVLPAGAPRQPLHDRLHDRLHRPGTAGPTARLLAAGLAADCLFALLTGTEDRPRLRIVDAEVVGWRVVPLAAAGAGRHPGSTMRAAIDPDHPAADELVGVLRLDTPDDWEQLPVSLARASGRPGETPAAGWGTSHEEAGLDALCGAVRGGRADRGSGLTEQEALADLRLRAATTERCRATGPAWSTGPLPGPARELAPAVAGPETTAWRVHPEHGGLRLAELDRGGQRVRAWGEDASDAVRRALGRALAVEALGRRLGAAVPVGPEADAAVRFADGTLAETVDTGVLHALTGRGELAGLPLLAAPAGAGLTPDPADPIVGHAQVAGLSGPETAEVAR